MADVASFFQNPFIIVVVTALTVVLLLVGFVAARILLNQRLADQRVEGVASEAVQVGGCDAHGRLGGLVGLDDGGADDGVVHRHASHNDGRFAHGLRCWRRTCGFSPPRDLAPAAASCAGRELRRPPRARPLRRRRTARHCVRSGGRVSDA